jgi:hypothetical protein
VTLNHRYKANKSKLAAQIERLWTKLEKRKFFGIHYLALPHLDFVRKLREYLGTDAFESRSPKKLLDKIPLVYVIPSRPIKGVFDFALESITSLEDLGYRDASSQLPNQLREAINTIQADALTDRLADH